MFKGNIMIWTVGTDYSIDMILLWHDTPMQ